jgi:3-oxoacyl-[acyl-carrier-protein] synthase-3
MANRTAVLTGLGSAVPDQIETNDMLAERMDTSDAWIHSRTGIKARRKVGKDTATSDLAVEAGARALKSAGVATVDAVVLATATPDYQCPATAPTVANRLGLGTVPAYDVGAVCSGFLYALLTGAGLIALGTAGRVLVIGAEAFTTIIDPMDRGTAPIFGDGAGAVVLEAGSPADQGALLGFDLGSDGDLAELIIVRAGGSRQRAAGTEPEPGDYFMDMQGKTVFANAVLRMEESSRKVLASTGWAVGEVDCLVGHQANARILRAVAEHLEIPAERAFINIEQLGNTAAASIPLALTDAHEAGVLQAGDRVLLTAFGAGATWGAVTLVWPALARS